MAVRPTGTAGTSELVETDGTTTNTLGTLSVPADGRFKVRADGTTLNAKAWTGGNEPAGRDLTATTTRTGPGDVSVRTSNTTATTAEARVDELTIGSAQGLVDITCGSL